MTNLKNSINPKNALQDPGFLLRVIILFLYIFNSSQAMANGRLHVDGRFIKDEKGHTVILRGVNITDLEHLNTKPHERPGINPYSVVERAIREYKANIIRIPILPGNSNYPHEGWFSKYRDQDHYFHKYLDPMVQYLTSRGIYVIIDLHYVEDFENKFPKVAEFWTYMAPKYKDNPFVLFELYNEPIYPDHWDTWVNLVANPGVALIRKYAPENLIIVGGPFWTAHMAGAAKNPVKGKNIVYAAHIYSNQLPESWEKNYGPLLEKFPVFVTEWGYQGETTSSVYKGTTSDFGKTLAHWLEKNQLSWTAWNFDSVWTPKMFDHEWNLLEGENYQGGLVRDLLLKNEK